MLMAVRLLGLGKHRSKGETSRIAVTVNGLMAGRPNRFPNGCSSTSRMTNLCASLTMQFTRLSISRAEVPSSANWSAVFAQGGRCAYRGPGHQGLGAR
jgi:hypothetical protein